MTGLGVIPAELIKQATIEVYEILRYILNICLINSDERPDDWKTVYLTPMYKKEPSNNPVTYRGINGRRSIPE